jgi:hypothetical protein
MADTDVGKKGTYHSEHGNVPCWVVEYEAGKDEGDHRIAGFCNTAMKQAGSGDVFNTWSQVGSAEGQFSLR